MKVWGILGAGAALLTACSGGGGGGDYCVGTFQGGSTSFGCTSCSGIDPFSDNPSPEVIDNNGDTYQDIGLGPGGTITLQIMAPDGVSFPAGVDAGAKIRFPVGYNVTAAYSLYNGSNPVAATSGSTISNGTSPEGAGEANYYEVVPAAEFNRIDLQLSIASNSTNVNFRLYEFCGDH